MPVKSTAQVPAFFKAIEDNDIETVRKYLAKNKLATEWRNDAPADQTGLMLASFLGHVEMMQLFIDADADVNAENQRGSTALIFAAHGGKAEAVMRLLMAGAAVDHKNVKLTTALMCAAWSGDQETVEAVLSAHPDLDAVDSDGKTAADYASVQQADSKYTAAEKEKFTNIILCLQLAYVEDMQLDIQNNGLGEPKPPPKPAPAEEAAAMEPAEEAPPEPKKPSFGVSWEEMLLDETPDETKKNAERAQTLKTPPKKPGR